MSALSFLSYQVLIKRILVICLLSTDHVKQQCFVLGPSAAELIALFLYQADVASSIAREIVGKENVSVNGTPVDSSAQYDGSL